MQPSILVHGGAGDDFADRLDAFCDGVRRAAWAGWDVLRNGGTALDAAVCAVQVLEDDPTFDAGHGSFLNRAGEVEMDAIVMDGVTLKNGAVAGIQRVSSPVAVARLVMERTPHCLLVGAGAEAFARSQGVAVCPMEELVAQSSTALLPPEHRRPAVGRDTVGAVVLDGEGRLAAATSTGGMADKLPGRVGDSPIIGCGAYADNQLGAASATGRGEDLMKIVFSKTACDLMGSGLAPQAAAEAALRRLEQRVQGVGGIILMNPGGEVGSACNTSHMVRAWFSAEGELCMRI